MYNRRNNTKRGLTLTILMALCTWIMAQSTVKARVTLDSYLIPLHKKGIAIGRVISPYSVKEQIILVSDTAKLFRIDKHGVISLRKRKMLRTEKGVHAYGITLAIGTQRYDIELVKDEFIRNKVVAHRGAWRQAGVMQNSIRSFQHAVDLGCEASEFDVWLSKDKAVILSHDPHIGGLSVEESTAKELYASTLAGGDPVPSLADFITIAKRQNKTKMILEIKPSPTGRNPELVDSVISIVNKLKAQAYIEYISFDYDVLKRIRAHDPTAATAYLTGNKTVEELAKDDVTGLDYDFYKYEADPELVEKAKSKGLTTNVWTVNKESALRTFLRSGVDRITTDEPELLLKLINTDI